MIRFISVFMVCLVCMLGSGCINNSPKNMTRSSQSSPDGYFESSGERWENKDWEQQNEGEAIQSWDD